MILKLWQNHFFSEINLFKMEKLQPNTNVSESNDSSERPIKQLQYEIVFLRDKLKNKNNLIRCVLDHLSLGDGIVCSNTEVASYRKSANDNILLTNEKKKNIIRVVKLILTKKVFWTITSYCTKRVLSLHLQQELNKSQNQVQSKVTQWTGRNKIQDLLIRVNKEMINYKQNKTQSSLWVTVWWNI